MKRIFKPLVTFLIILVQSALAVTAGAAALSKASVKALPAGAYVEALPIGNLSHDEAVKAVESNYSGQTQLKSLNLTFPDGKTFEIPFTQIDANVDAGATVEKMMPQKGFKGAFDVFHTRFANAEQSIQPFVKFNEGKLRTALIEIAKEVNVLPVNATIGVKDGIVVKKAETNGKELNVSSTVNRIQNQLSISPWESVAISDTEFLDVEAPVRMKDYDDIQQVFAEYSINVADAELFKSIEFAVEAINGSSLEPSGVSGSADVFSFVEILKDRNAAFETDNEGYDQVASALYATLLSAGIPTDSITRVPHKLSVDYIKPGLDAWISGNAGDLKFTNPFKHKVAVFAQLDGDRINVALAGNMSDFSEKFKLETEIVQTFAPPVYNVENSDLKPGEKIVLTAGKEGIVVNVLRNGEVIGTDTYEPEKAIVQIGPDTEWKKSDK